ncbi:MAG: DUF4097 domain-containing protein [Lachnospiraceae bacterium]|nr:DUF4097 domain-containing protein [Lachnospiraceae bacterium]
MKKNIYLTIIWSITIFTIIAGTFYHTTEWGARFLSRLGLKDNYKTQNFDENLNAFDKISLDMDISEIKITEGSDFHISYESTKNLIPEYEIKNGTLEVIQTSKNPYFPKRNGNDNCTIVITVPKGTSLSDISCTCDIGEIQLDNLTSENIFVTCDIGETKLSNLSATDITCNCNMGECEISNCSFDNLNADNNMGDINVNGNLILSDYTIECSVSMGEIEVNGNDYHSYNQKGETDKTITLSNNMGSIEIEGR